MSKPNTFGKKPFSLRADRDDADASDAPLYGHVTALNAMENAAEYTMKAASSPAFMPTTDSESSMKTASFSTTPVEISPLAAIVPSAITYPSTSISKVYQHWADGDAARGTTAEWNNNILSDGKSDYFEGEVVPHVYFYKASNNTPLTNGQTYSFNVTYNYYQSNTNAGGFVYMTTPNADRSPSSFAGGTAQADSTFTNGGGMQGSFYTVNANITAVSNVTYTGSLSSSKDGVVTVTFVYTGPTTTSGGAEIQYGLLIAAPGDVPNQGKGLTDGANAWTGGSLQTTVDIGGSGATSIQLAPSAIIVGEISGTKFSDMDGNGVRDANGADDILGNADDEVGLANWKIFLDQDNDGQWDTTEQFVLTDALGKYTLSVTPDSDRSDPDNDPYIVREVQQTGWVQTTTNPAPILITALDPTEVNVNFGNMLQQPSLNIVKDASVDGGFADAAGDVISYNISVQNTGNQTLTGVTVIDPFISNLVLTPSAATADNELDVGETWFYTASHTVTQAEIDAGTNIVNTATADSNQTGPDTDDASIPVDQNPALNIVKEATVAGGAADAVGDIIYYDISVQNTGNQTLTGITVTDPFIGTVVLTDSAATADGELDVGETWYYTGSHTVTLAEMDLGADIVNTATADSNQTEPDTDDAFVPVTQSPGIAIDKAIIGVNGGNGNGTLDAVNDIIRYAIIVSNTGNITLNDVTVTDPFTNLTVTGGTLAPGASETYLTSYTLTQNDLDTNGGGDGFIENTATADSRETGSVSDTESLKIFSIKALYINKKLTSVTDGNDNQVADAADDVLNYLVTVTNLGAITLTNVSVVDESTGLNESGLTLLPGESKTYETFYTLKQSDLDDNGKGDGYIDNVATADSDQTEAISDNEATPLLRTVGLGVEKNITDIAGGKLFVDAAGQVITYDIRVYNAGSVTLTGVTVTDELTNMNVTIPTLAPGEFQNYVTTYTVTQADLNNNGGGNGAIENITVADSVETPAVSDDETAPLLARPLLFVNKSFLNVTEGNGNNLVDAVGDKLNYLILVANPGNVTLTDVSVLEPLTNLNLSGLTLAPNGVLTYQTSYVLTQADLDNNGGGDGYIDNIVLVDSAQTPQASDVESAPILRSIALAFDKEFVNVTGGNSNTFADHAGDELNFSFTVTNQGTVTLTNVVVTDPLTGLNTTLASLDPGKTAVLESTYILQQSDLDTNGGGDGRVENTATADSDQTIAVTDIEGVTVIYDAQIDLTKYVSVDGGSTWQDANLPTGPSLSSALGINPQYKYTALNDGTVTLQDLTLTDGAYDLNGGAAGLALDWGDLAPGLTAEFIFEAPFMLGQNSGDAIVTATALAPVVDIDNAYYLGV
ncbi:hypothetical protein [Limnohabitans sp. 2KL-17]|uniref:beta strand repeat-containing protein n=1 Tax=Limnohabitans sp. 2KL-17 TaxID=1100704 RepID=UPI001304AD88|nr:hypothetical protein [Limnohabitans sp. 2KL-17]